MSQSEMSEIYNLKIETIDSAKTLKKIKKEWIIKDKNTVFINVSKIIKRYEFKRKIINQMHDNYYFLGKHLRDNELAELMSIISDIEKGSFYSFFQRNLFYSQSDNILNYKLSKMQWNFYRLSTAIIHVIFRKKNIKRENRDLMAIFK